METKHKKSSGFSLVELMIVVGIIAVLSAMLIPRMRVFSARARQTEAVTNIGSLETLQRIYFDQTGSFSHWDPTKPVGLNNLIANPTWTVQSCDFSYGGPEVLGFKLFPCDPVRGVGPRHMYYSNSSGSSVRLWVEAGEYNKNKIWPGCQLNGLQVGGTFVDRYNLWITSPTSFPAIVLENDVKRVCK